MPGSRARRWTMWAHTPLAAGGAALQRIYLKLAAAATLTAASALASAGFAPATQAATSAASDAGAAAPTGPVASTPVTSIPHFPAQTPATEVIRQIVQCGSTMYAVGTFTVVKRQSTSYARNNVFSFSANPPYSVTSWAPDINGTVNSIAFNGGNCADAYIGGKFTAVGSTTAKNIAEIDTTTGGVVTTFGHNASGQVETLAGDNNHIIAGGYFTGINGSAADPYLVSLSPVTGKDDGFIKLNISGSYQYPGVSANTTNIYNQELSHSGTLDLVMGDFTSAGGQPRQQIFMLNLATSPASVTAWTSPQWDGSQGMATPQNPNNGYPYQCATVEPFYIQAAAWSPDDSTVYIATTGYHPNGWPVGATPRTGLCDAAAAFPATQGPVLSEWINYTGCDSLFAAAADSFAAYFGGHERWSMNSNNCDQIGPGGIVAPGMEGLDPATGNLLLNSQGTALYTRARGLGADDMLLTSAGLWIASDNYQGSQMCGGVNGLAGLCLLPYGS
jgi:hypothetical protein